MAPKGKCSQFKMPLPVKSGTNLNLQLTSTNPANLYLLPTETFQTSADGCSLIGSSILTANNFTSYNLQWTATGDSTVYLLLIGPNTIILVRDHGSTVSVEQLATMIYASTETNPQLYSSIDIANYTATATTTSTSHTYFPPSIPYALSFVAILVMFLGPILLLGSKKGIARLKALKNAVC